MKRIAGLAVIVVAALAAQPGFAQPAGAGAGSLRAACAADVTKLCPDAQPGNGSIRQCFASHRDQLSDGCKAALAAAMARRQAGAQSGAPHG